MMRLQRKKSGLVWLFLMVAILLPGGDFAVAKKAKEAAGGGQAELEKGLEPVSKNLAELQGKIHARSLFSQKDVGKLLEIRNTLEGLMASNATSPLLAKPVYDAGILAVNREYFDDAYDYFSFLASNFPEHPYGLKAKSQIRQLRKKLGEDYFPEVPEAAKPNGAEMKKASKG